MRSILFTLLLSSAATADISYTATLDLPMQVDLEQGGLTVTRVVPGTLSFAVDIKDSGLTQLTDHASWVSQPTTVDGVQNPGDKIDLEISWSVDLTTAAGACPGQHAPLNPLHLYGGTERSGGIQMVCQDPNTLSPVAGSMNIAGQFRDSISDPTPVGPLDFAGTIVDNTPPFSGGYVTYDAATYDVKSITTTMAFNGSATIGDGITLTRVHSPMTVTTSASVSAVPEPSAFACMGLVGLLLSGRAWWTRRRR